MDSVEVLFERSRRAYERGRMRVAGAHALTLAALSAGASLVFVGVRGLVWLPLTVLLWSFVEWRGTGLLRGGRVGALAGFVTVAMPMGLLRTCCKPGAMPMSMMPASCCSMPGACAMAGVAVGLVLAALLPRGERRRETVVGMLLGVVAVAPMKCASLLVGEAMGLVFGLVGGVLVTSFVREVAYRVRARA